ncbi:branched-chain amino acid ABC transporter ATP-binding protein/permease [Paraburkholderia susongensis]|uniref:Branched-chain amino acid transport system permease protein n=1 Tax=Paraburkholderia susongensis TaxID=1515439 RepID=A0A1X7L850_9BURK|nr:branched-chain amino acid ABC transporter ATP-binding protein/permease [Paraburkholderia susongensis]SMG49895.1 branched-chain amino acid transport system permease protein [Paraburkholderia susongensis]
MNIDETSRRPAQPGTMGRIRREYALAGLIFAAVLLSLMLSPTYYVGLVAVAGVNSIVVLGLAFLLATGQLSLGHAAFLGLGAYASSLLTLKCGVPPLAAIPLATVLCAAIGWFLGKLTLGMKGHYLPLATLAYGMAISACFVAQTELTGGASGLTGIPALSLFGVPMEARGMATLIWAVVLLVFLAYRRIYRSRVGRVARALRSNSTMASAFGADVARVKTQVFVMSAALGGLAGALYAYYMQFLSPSSFSLGASINLLIMTVLGGVAHPLGALLGVVFFNVLELSGQHVIANVLGLPGQVESMVLGAVLIIALLKWPDGLLTWAGVTNSYDVEPDDVPAVSRREPSHPATLDAQAVTKRFGGLTALSEVTVNVPERTITGLIGPNGAGKSTLFNVMTGVLPASSGSVTVSGRPLPGKLRKVIACGIARTFQHVQLVQELDVLQNVLIGGYIRGRSGLLSAAVGADRHEESVMVADALAALRRVGLSEIANARVSELPLGSQRLVEIARALMARPAILLLDEPAAGLRAPEKQRLSQLLQSLRDDDGMTVLIVEHDMELVMGCADYLFVLNYGSLLAQGAPHEVQQNPDVVHAYLGAQA